MILNEINDKLVDDIQQVIREDYDFYTARLTDDRELLTIAHLCESPVEAILFWQLIFSLHLKEIDLEPTWNRQETTFGVSSAVNEEGYSIVPNELAGDVDFIGLFVQENILVEGKLYRPDFRIQVWGPKMKEDPRKINDFIVEVDGHDFHERTKSQAIRDKRRDRAIQRAGYRIMHFTGSEVYRDPASVVAEIINDIRCQF